MDNLHSYINIKPNFSLKQMINKWQCLGTSECLLFSVTEINHNCAHLICLRVWCFLLVLFSVYFSLEFQRCGNIQIRTWCVHCFLSYDTWFWVQSSFMFQTLTRWKMILHPLNITMCIFSVEMISYVSFRSLFCLSTNSSRLFFFSFLSASYSLLRLWQRASQGPSDVSVFGYMSASFQRFPCLEGGDHVLILLPQQSAQHVTGDQRLFRSVEGWGMKGVPVGTRWLLCSAQVTSQACSTSHSGKRGKGH